MSAPPPGDDLERVTDDLAEREDDVLPGLLWPPGGYGIHRELQT